MEVPRGGASPREEHRPANHQEQEEQVPDRVGEVDGGTQGGPPVR